MSTGLMAWGHKRAERAISPDNRALIKMAASIRDRECHAAMGLGGDGVRK